MKKSILFFIAGPVPTSEDSQRAADLQAQTGVRVIFRNNQWSTPGDTNFDEFLDVVGHVPDFYKEELYGDESKALTANGLTNLDPESLARLSAGYKVFEALNAQIAERVEKNEQSKAFFDEKTGFMLQESAMKDIFIVDNSAQTGVVLHLEPEVFPVVFDNVVDAVEVGKVSEVEKVQVQDGNVDVEVATPSPYGAVPEVKSSTDVLDVASEPPPVVVTAKKRGRPSSSASKKSS